MEELIEVIKQYKDLGIDKQIDYEKFYLYSIITHSTAIEGSTVTEIENQLLFDEGITAGKRPLLEQLMNLDLHSAYQEALLLAKQHAEITIDMLKHFSSLVMKNTGSQYSTALGDFDVSRGDLRLLNVSAGFGGQSYLSYQKVPRHLELLCRDLNESRQKISGDDILGIYRLSFEAHYRLVTIHPWADGNGRMSRLLMNFIQFEFGALPVKVQKEAKSEYIQSLQVARDSDDMEPFIQFMLSHHTSNLQQEIATYKRSSQQ